VKFGVRRAATIAIVGVAVALEACGGVVTKLTLAATAASPAPVVLDETTCGLAGAVAGEEAWDTAAQRLLAVLAPIADLRGSVDYRLHLAQVGARRALRLAYARWQGVAHA
jgi:carbon-monoxide dehydrogenase medium subunit